MYILILKPTTIEHTRKHKNTHSISRVVTSFTSNGLWKFPPYSHETMKAKKANHVLLPSRNSFDLGDRPLQRSWRRPKTWRAIIWEPMQSIHSKVTSISSD